MNKLTNLKWSKKIISLVLAFALTFTSLQLVPLTALALDSGTKTWQDNVSSNIDKAVGVDDDLYNYIDGQSNNSYAASVELIDENQFSNVSLIFLGKENNGTGSSKSYEVNASTNLSSLTGNYSFGFFPQSFYLKWDEAEQEVSYSIALTNYLNGMADDYFVNYASYSNGKVLVDNKTSVLGGLTGENNKVNLTVSGNDEDKINLQPFLYKYINYSTVGTDKVTTVVIPDGVNTQSINTVFKAIDQFGVNYKAYSITYSLKESRNGVSVDSNTGVVTVTNAANSNDDDKLDFTVVANVTANSADFSKSESFAVEYPVELERTPYKVTLDANGGSFVNGTVTVSTIDYLSKYGDFLSTMPIRDGYAFLGWYDESTDGHLFTKDTMLEKTEDHKLYAHWKEYNLSTPQAVVSKSEETYGYQNNPIVSVLTSNITDDTNIIDGYQWYLNGNPISNATSKTYDIPLNLNTGTYTYKCNVRVKDNNDSSIATTFSSEVTFTVNKKTVVVTPNDDQSKYYGASDPTNLEYSVSGAITGYEPVFSGKLSRESGEIAGTYIITQGTLALTADDINLNYDISFSNNVIFTIRMLQLSAAEIATLTGTKGENDWYITKTNIVAPTGFKISKQSDIDGTWSELITNDDGDYTNQGITYYLRRISDGAISSALSISYKQDTTVPTATVKVASTPIKTFLEVVTFGLYNAKQKVTLTSNDDMSGVENQYYYIHKVDEVSIFSPPDLNAVTWTKYTGPIELADENAKVVVYVKIVDVAGNTAYVNSDGVVIDIDKPLVTINATLLDGTEYASGTWVDQYVKLVPISTNTFGTPSYECAYDKNDNGRIEASEWDSVPANGLIVSEDIERLYVFRAVSESRMVTEESQYAKIEVNIDTKAPEGRIKINTDDIWDTLNAITFEKFFKETQNVTISVTDISPVQIDYYVSNVAVDKCESITDWVNYTGVFRINPDNNYVIYARFIDSVGKVVYVNSEGLVLDKTAPTVDSDNAEKWCTDADGVVRVNVSDNLAQFADDDVSYKIEGIEASNTVTLIADGDGYYFNVPANKLNPNADNGESKIIVTATDKAGNTKIETITVFVDTVAPTAVISGNVGSAEDYAASQTITINPNVGVSGIKKVEIKGPDGTWEDITTTYESGYIADTNGTYVVRVTNGADVVGELSNSLTFGKIDNHVPAIKVTATTIDNQTYLSGRWVNKDVKITLTDILKENTTPITYYYSTDRVNWIEIPDYQDSIVLSAEQSNDYYFYAETYTGVRSLSSDKPENSPFTVRIDKTAPTGEVTFDEKDILLSKDTVQVNVVGADKAAGSGIYSIDYCKSNVAYADAAALERSGVIWTSISSGGTISVPPVTKTIIYVKLIDNAGNVSYISSNDENNFLIVENNTPSIRTAYKKEGNEWESAGVKVGVSVADDRSSVESGIDSISYLITSSKSAPSTWDSATSVNVTDSTGTTTFEAVTPNSKDTYYIHIKAVDKCGNVAIRTIEAHVINEKEKPESEDTNTAISHPQNVDVTYGNNAMFSVEAETTQNIKSLQWEKLNVTNGQWEAVLDGEDYSGVTTFNLTVKHPVVADTGDKYRLTMWSDFNVKTVTNEAYLNVHKATIYIQANAKTVYFGQDEAALDYIFCGAQYGEIPGFTGNLERNSGRFPGSYDIKIGTLNIVNNGDFDTNNYGITYQTNKYTIREYHPSDNATIEGVAGTNDWYITSVKLNAPEGFLISKSQNGPFTEYLTNFLDGDYRRDGVDYYIRNNISSSTDFGAISVVKNITFKQDTTIPTINVVVDSDENTWDKVLDTITFGLIFNRKVVTTISSKDDTSGLLRIYYYLSETALSEDDLKAIPHTDWFSSSSSVDSATGITKISVTTNPDEKVIVYARAIDKAGNTVYASSDGLIVDGTAPVLTTEDDGIWLIRDTDVVSVKLTEELSGIDNIVYSIDGAANVVVDNSIITADGTFEIPTDTIPQEKKNVVIRVTAKDIAKNSSEELVITVNKDTIPVTASIATDSDLSTIEQSKTLVISQTTGISEVKSVTVQKLDNNGVWVDLDNAITGPNPDGTYECVVAENGTYRTIVENGAVDRNGNGQEAVSDPITIATIDTATPKLSVFTGSYTAGKWTNKDVTLTATNQNVSNLGNTSYLYSTDNGNTWNEMPNGKLTISTDTNEDLMIKAVSESGVESVAQTYNVKIDKISPTGEVTVETNKWQQFVNTITFGLIYNRNVESTITCSDDTTVKTVSPVKIEYYLTNKQDGLTEAQVKTLSNDKWKVYTSEIALTADEANKYVVYARLTDEAGNVSYLSSDGVAFDNTAPVISGATNGETYYADHKITVSDLNLVSVTVIKNSETPIVISVAGKTMDEVLNEINAIVTNDDSIYTISAIDIPGNTSQIQFTLKSVDTFLGEIPDALTYAEVIDSITKIDNLFDQEGTQPTGNLSDDEKEALLEKRQSLISSIIDNIAQHESAVIINNHDNIAEIDEDAINEILKNEFDANDVEVFVAGGRVEIVLDVTSSAIDTVNGQAAKADGNKAIKNLKITIVKNTYNDSRNLVSTTSITSLTESIQFSTTVDAYGKSGRVFYVYRNHNNNSMKFTDLDTVDSTTTFESDLFSDFTLAYLPDTDITGNVKDVDGKIVPGAKVELKDPVSGTVIKTTTTDESGNYVLDGVADGNYKVVITSPDNTQSVTNDVTIDLAGTPVVFNAVINNYHTTGEINGIVTDADDKVVEDSKVELKDPVSGNVVATTKTDESGKYKFESIPSGNYNVEVTAPDESQSVVKSATAMTNGAACVVDVQLSEYHIAGNIAGTVLDSDGKPIEGLEVELKDPITGNTIATTATDEDGNYGFKGIPNGDYDVEVSSPDESAAITNSVIVTTNKTSRVPDVIFDGYHTTGTVKGSVEDKSNNPIADVKVELLDEDGNPILDKEGNPVTAVTDENGQYTITDVPNGTYQIKITLSDGKVEYITIEIENGEVPLSPFFVVDIPKISDEEPISNEEFIANTKDTVIPLAFVMLLISSFGSITVIEGKRKKIRN